jgi:RNA polymerase sigma-70 factor, ECF subfamily
MNKPGDKVLVRRCKEGDRQAMEALIIKYEKPVFNAAYRMLNSSEEARDVTQTVFLKVFENLDRYDPNFRFFSWIYRIAMNESIDCLKKLNRLGSLETEPESEMGDPEEAASQGQRVDSVQLALATIKQEYRMVIVLKHFLDCSYGEISHILDIPEKKVKSRLFTGRQLLKEALSKHGIH